MLNRIQLASRDTDIYYTVHTINTIDYFIPRDDQIKRTPKLRNAFPEALPSFGGAKNY
jgi:hypothetical protein